MMNAETDAVPRTLKTSFRECIPGGDTARSAKDTAAGNDYPAVAGGERVMGLATSMSLETFLCGAMDGS